MACVLATRTTGLPFDRTGPVLVPDFTSAQANTIDRLELAHVAYNRLDWAEFILRRPTAITADGEEVL